MVTGVAAFMKRMRELGAPAEAIEFAVEQMMTERTKAVEAEAVARAERDSLAARRKADADRQFKRRNGGMSRDITGQHVTSQDVTGHRVTSQDGPAAPLDAPPLPPAPPSPPFNPPTTPLFEPDGSAAGAAPAVDHRRDLFSRGLAEIRKLTGKAEPQCRTLMGKWLRDAQDSAVVVMAAIDSAVADEVANPVPYIAAIISREAQRNGSGSSDLFVGSAAGGRRHPAGNSAVTAAMARRAGRGGIGPGVRQDASRPGDQGHPRAGRDDSAIEDADWSPAGSYRATH